MLASEQVDVVFRLHQKRKVDYEKCTRLGPDDHLVTWVKPTACPKGLDESTYASLPATLTLRLVRVHVKSPGCRTRVIDVVTTLLDATKHPKEEIGDLYHKRWHVELDIRSIKKTLKMDVLSCKTPEMVRKEAWIHFLTYNLIRKAMAQSAQQQGKHPRGLSFAGAKQTLDEFRGSCLQSDGEKWQTLVGVLLVAIGTHEVGNRPGRCEPREVKRRPKTLGLLMKPRSQRRAELLKTNG